MAKSRVDGTPEKPGRKTSPAKPTKASAAKSANSKVATPERTTRSSPRRTVPSAKAQEAAADHVQTGRVAKKTSLSKATTPVKKASPKKTVKATTPAKEASPEKATKRTTPEKKVTSTKKSPSKSTTPTKAQKEKSFEEYRKFVRKFEDSNGFIFHDFARYVIRHGIINCLETADVFDQRTIVRCYHVLLENKAELDGNARATDDELTRQLRSIYLRVKKNMRSILGAGFDECLKDSTSMGVFAGALRAGLENQGFADANGIVPRTLEIPRASMPAIRVTADLIERVKRGQDRAFERRAEHRAEREASGLTFEQYRDQVLAGRVVKPSSRAASRSRSPAKNPVKREREASVSRPVRARSQSPMKAATRTASKSPAPIGRPTTSSRSPAKVVHVQPAETGRQNRSKSPAKASTRQASKSPAPIETTKTRSRSPAKAKEASPTPLKVTKTRSKSPAKADASQATAVGRTRGTSKSPARKDSLYQPTGDDDEDEPGKLATPNLIKVNILTPHQYHRPKRPQRSHQSNEPLQYPTKAPPRQKESDPPLQPKQHQNQPLPEPEAHIHAKSPRHVHLTPTNPAAAKSSRPQTPKQFQP